MLIASEKVNVPFVLDSSNRENCSEFCIYHILKIHWNRNANNYQILSYVTQLLMFIAYEKLNVPFVLDSSNRENCSEFCIRHILKIHWNRIANYYQILSYVTQLLMLIVSEKVNVPIVLDSSSRENCSEFCIRHILENHWNPVTYNYQILSYVTQLLMFTAYEKLNVPFVHDSSNRENCSEFWLCHILKNHWNPVTYNYQILLYVTQLLMLIASEKVNVSFVYDSSNRENCW